jgi:hypothetical protein
MDMLVLLPFDPVPNARNRCGVVVIVASVAVAVTVAPSSSSSSSGAAPPILLFSFPLSLPLVALYSVRSSYDDPLANHGSHVVILIAALIRLASRLIIIDGWPSLSPLSFI